MTEAQKIPTDFMSEETEETEFRMKPESTQTEEPQGGSFRTLLEPGGVSEIRGDLSVTEGLETQGLETRQNTSKVVMAETESKNKKTAAVQVKVTEQKEDTTDNTEEHPQVSQNNETLNESPEMSAEAVSHQKQFASEADAKIHKLKDKSKLSSKPFENICLIKKLKETDQEEKILEAENIEITPKIQEADNITIQSKTITVNDTRTSPTEEQDAATESEILKKIQTLSPKMEQNTSDSGSVRLEQTKEKSSVPAETEAASPLVQTDVCMKITDGKSSESFPLEEEDRKKERRLIQSDVIIKDVKSNADSRGDQISPNEEKVETAKDPLIAEDASNICTKIKKIRDIAGSKHDMAESVSAKESEEGLEELQGLEKPGEAPVEAVKYSKVTPTEDMELILKQTQITETEIKPEGASKEPAEKEVEVSELEASSPQNERRQMSDKSDRDETAVDTNKTTVEEEHLDTAVLNMIGSTEKQQKTEATLDATKRESISQQKCTLAEDQEKVTTVKDETLKYFPLKQTIAMQEQMGRKVSVTPIIEKTSEEPKIAPEKLSELRKTELTAINENISEADGTLKESTFQKLVKIREAVDKETLPKSVPVQDKTTKVRSIEDWTLKSHEQQLKVPDVCHRRSTRKEGMAEPESSSLKEETQTSPKTEDTIEELQSEVVLDKDRNNQTPLAEDQQFDAAVRGDPSKTVSQKKGGTDKIPKSRKSEVKEEKFQDTAVLDVYGSIKPLGATKMKHEQEETMTLGVSAEKPTTVQNVKTGLPQQSSVSDDVVKEKAEEIMLNLVKSESNRAAPLEKKSLNGQESFEVTQEQSSAEDGASERCAGKGKEPGDIRQSETFPTKTEESLTKTEQTDHFTRLEEKNQTEVKVKDQKQEKLSHKKDIKHISHETNEQSEQVSHKKEAAEQPKFDKISDIILEDVTKKSRSLKENGQRLEQHINVSVDDTQSKMESSVFTLTKTTETKPEQAQRVIVAPGMEVASEELTVAPLQGFISGDLQRFVVANELEKDLASRKKEGCESQSPESTKESVDVVAEKQEVTQLKQVTSQLTTALDKIPAKQKIKAPREDTGLSSPGQEEVACEDLQSKTDRVKDVFLSVSPTVDTKQQQIERKVLRPAGMDAADEKLVIAKEQDALAPPQRFVSRDRRVEDIQSTEREGYRSPGISLKTDDATDQIEKRDEIFPDSRVTAVKIHSDKTKAVPQGQDTSEKYSRMGEVVGDIPTKVPELTKSGVPREDVQSEMVTCRTDPATAGNIKGAEVKLEHAESRITVTPAAEMTGRESLLSGRHTDDRITAKQEGKASKEDAKYEQNKGGQLADRSEESKHGLDGMLCSEPSVTEQTSRGQQSDDTFRTPPPETREVPQIQSIIDTSALTPEGKEHVLLQEAPRGIEEELSLSTCLI